jgi:hypothetical protein
MLGQRIDRYQRLELLGQLPIQSQLDLVESRPLLDEAERSGGQMPLDDR